MAAAVQQQLGQQQQSQQQRQQTIIFTIGHQQITSTAEQDAMLQQRPAMSAQIQNALLEQQQQAAEAGASNKAQLSVELLKHLFAVVKNSVDL
jgi:hypothetical protein